MLKFVLILVFLAILGISVMYYRNFKKARNKRISILGFIGFYIMKMKNIYAVLTNSVEEQKWSGLSVVNDDKLKKLNIKCKELQQSLNVVNKEMEQYKVSVETKYNELFIEKWKVDKCLLTANESLQNYENMCSGLFPIDTLEVSMPFCEEFKYLDMIIREAYEKLQYFLSQNFDSCSVETISAISDYEIDRNERSCIYQEILSWYLLAKNISAISKNLAFDILGKMNNEQRLLFLRKHSFEKYFRPQISSLLMLLEFVRYNNRSKRVEAIIEECLLSLEAQNIRVEYIAIGSILEESRFGAFEIEPSSSEETEKDTVLKIKKFGVISKSFDCSNDKTIVELNM